MKYELPTVLFQEKDCVKNHGKELCQFGTKALIITGKSSAKKNGAYKDVTDALDTVGITHVLFDQIEENPSVATCVHAAELGLKEQVDFCIGIGGGSPLDASKAIALLIGNKTTDPAGFYEPKLLFEKAVPVVNVPTTAGTGSEATPYAILTLHEKHTKKSISHRIYPALSLCDSKYLHFVPDQILKNTAVDTLAHLIESYLNTNSTAYSRMFTEYALKLWGQIKDCLLTGSFTDAQYDTLMEASTIAGMSITHTSTSIPHGLSYPVTYENNVPHGAACGLFLPGYMAFCEKKESLGAKAKSDVITNKDTATIYSLLGVSGYDAFKDMLTALLGKIPVSAKLWEENVALMMDNPLKLNNCPYEITKEELELFL